MKTVGPASPFLPGGEAGFRTFVVASACVTCWTTHDGKKGHAYADYLSWVDLGRGCAGPALPAWEDVLEMYNLRLLLEPETARAAAAQADDRVPGLLRATVGQMSELSAVPLLAGHYQGYRALSNIDTLFHDTIAESSGNKLVRRTLASLHAHTLLYRVWYHAGFADETVREHEAVIDAIAAHNSRAAGKAMRDHLERSRDRFLQVATSGAESLSGT